MPRRVRRGSRMKQLRWLALVAAGLASMVFAAPVAADAVYHTERLELQPVSGASGTGMVVNIHPNGPRNFAQERYALRNAEPFATYTVVLVIDASALDCDFDSLTITMKAALVTNAAGNATSPADFVFRPED